MTDDDRASRNLASTGRASVGTGYLLPDVALRTASGQPVVLGQHGARRNLVVVLLGDAAAYDFTRALLAEIGASSARFEEENARLLVISARDAALPSVGWSGPAPPLFGTDAALYGRVGAVSADGRPLGAVYVADRFREIYAAFEESKPGWPPTVDDILRWLLFINIQCPECGAPEW